MNYKEMRYLKEIKFEIYDMFSSFKLLRKPYIYGVPTERGVKMI